MRLLTWALCFFFITQAVTTAVSAIEPKIEPTKMTIKTVAFLISVFANMVSGVRLAMCDSGLKGAVAGEEGVEIGERESFFEVSLEDDLSFGFTGSSCVYF